MFNVDENFLNALIGFAFGLIIGRAWALLVSCYYRLKAWIDGLWTKSGITAFLPLDGERGFYYQEDTELTHTGEFLCLGIPVIAQDKLNVYKFTSNPQSAELWNALTVYLQQLLDVNGQEAEQVIHSAAQETADAFLKELSVGLPRFNGKLLTPKGLSINRNGTRDENIIEVPGFGLSFYDTDYFTHRTIGTIFQTLKIRNKAPHINPADAIRDANENMNLISSFGLSSFLIIQQGGDEKVLLTKRSKKVVVDADKWHLSMNEAFTSADREADQNRRLSLFACLQRGYEEELGITSEKFIQHIGNDYGFFYLGLLLDRFELGVSSYVRLQLKRGLDPMRTLAEWYAQAQDGQLEIGRMELVPISHIRPFIKKHKNEMSALCYCVLRKLVGKYEHGYMRK